MAALALNPRLRNHFTLEQYLHGKIPELLGCAGGTIRDTKFKNLVRFHAQRCQVCGSHISQRPPILVHRKATGGRPAYTVKVSQMELHHVDRLRKSTRDKLGSLRVPKGYDQVALKKWLSARVRRLASCILVCGKSYGCHRSLHNNSGAPILTNQ